MCMKSLFPYFGAKSKIVEDIWDHLGDTDTYLEPFCGSAAVLFGRPGSHKSVETINDLDGFITNCWRSIKYYPEKVAQYADYPVSELDVEARHHYLCHNYASLIDKMRIDVEYCDPKLAGYWIYGACIWIGGGWCCDKLIKKYENGNEPEVVKKINSDFEIINRENYGKLPRDSRVGIGIHRKQDIYELILAYSERLRYVRVCCGDWKRLFTESVLKKGKVGIFLDPPYSNKIKWDNYRNNKKQDVWTEVTDWCVNNQHRDNCTIILCGHDGTWDPDREIWKKYNWTRSKGYAKNNNNRFLECYWVCNSRKQQKIKSYSFFEN